MPSARITLVRPGPSSATTLMARINEGNACTMSISREMNVSTRPPYIPASRPSGAPSSIASATVATEMVRELRPPASTRANMSRPKLSVPKGCSKVGAWRTGPTSWAIGSYRPITGDNTARTTSINSTPKPRRTRADRAYGRRNSHSLASRPAIGTAVLAMQLYPRVHQTVHQVSSQVNHRKCHREEHHDHLNDRI